ncbi:MAG TPA: lamin tail domain-containing protein [Tepidisphaeraceae bacterium]
MKKAILASVLALVVCVSSRAMAAMQITEFCSNSGVGNFEFVEFTNTGPVPVDMSGWSEDDSNRTPNKAGHVLSAFGSVQPGESVIYTEATPDAFRQYWWGSVAAAPAGLKIIGPYTNDNLSSSSDEINLFDNASPTPTLIDRLTYPGTGGGTASSITRNAPIGYLANSNNNAAFIDSAVGDVFGSFHASQNQALVGNPGSYLVPEPASLAGIMLAGFAGLIRRSRNGRSPR